MKVICVPLNKEAEIRLDMDASQDGDLDELILNEETICLLWKSGIIEKLNEGLGLIIDEYEDEVIPHHKISQASEIINIAIADSQNFLTVLKPLLNLLHTAQNCGTGVHFYL